MISGPSAPSAISASASSTGCRGSKAFSSARQPASAATFRSSSGVKPCRLILQAARLLLQEDRDAVADGKRQPCGAADQLLPLAVIFERRLCHRADQDFQEFRVDGPAAAGRPFRHLVPPHCIGAAGAFASASAISVMAIRILARSAWSADSSSACFSAGPHGLIIDSAVTRPALEARLTLSQSASRLFAFK